MFLSVPVILMPNNMHSFETNPSNVPAFLIKLWKLVEDPSCNDLIAWSDSGTSFIIKDQIRFSRELLPQYFKHNNMASFIRQLNMYGFRKVMNYEKTGLRNETDEMEFQHTFFSKGQISLLAHIKRKIPNTKVAEPAVKSNARDILTDLTSIREKQESMDNMLLKMKQENELLWRELTNMRKKHKAQEHVIQKVIQFLVSIVQRSNQNIGVQRKIPRMLADSSTNQGKSQVTCTIDVLRNKNSKYITADKLVKPPGPVIHEVTDVEPDQEENMQSPFVKSPEENTSERCSPPLSENQESEGPPISSLNSPINTSAMEPLSSILEPLQPSTPSLNSDGRNEEILGIPLEYINSPINVISIPDDEHSDNIISLPDNSASLCFSPPPNKLVCASSKSDFDDSLLTESLQTPKVPDSLLTESLQTPKIPAIHLDDLYSYDEKSTKENDTSLNRSNAKNDSDPQNTVQQLPHHNEHDYQLALSDSSNMLKSPSLTKKKNSIGEYPNVRKNTFTNHVISVEEGLNLLSDHFLNQISSGTYDDVDVDADKLLGLFSTDDVANNESLVGEISNQTPIKAEPVDIVGNELVQFTPLMLDPVLNIGNNQFLQCLNEDTEAPSEENEVQLIDQKNFLADVLIKTDQEAASEAAEYLMSNLATTKQKNPRRPKIQKVQKAKRRKLK